MFPLSAFLLYRKLLRNSLYILDGGLMIEVTKLDGVILTVNDNFIVTVEETPDTVITMSTGRKIIVKESRQEIQNLVKSFRKEFFADKAD
jgi:flagellar protein FlbD